MNAAKKHLLAMRPQGVSTGLILLAMGFALDALIAVSLGTPV